MPYNTRRAARTNRGFKSFRPRHNKRGAARKDFIHHSKFVRPARNVTQEEYVPTNLFSDFIIDPILHENIAKKGYVTPSAIQDQAIPVALTGKDVIGIANTGTGKTAAFAVPVLHSLLRIPTSRALIMAPTRELAEQIEAECRALGKGAGFTGALLIGGSSYGPQLRDLKSKPRIVVGTPGRIKDHAERGTLDLSKYDVVVLDEVDRMLDMGFIHDMQEILTQLSTPRQSLFFSATMDHAVRKLIDNFSVDPVMITVKTGDTAESVDQNVIGYTSSSDKIEKLHETLIQEHVEKVVVFDETQRSVESLSIDLVARGFKVDAIHGGKSQAQRQRALRRFKNSEINILVATDVAARGIDVADISHVINYSQPQTYDDYVHRIGRAGRAGKTGYALTFVKGI
jgi:superfamily II DNA/RNA helicase